MAVSLEMIEILRDRAHVTYEEAKEALEKCDNDVVEALIYLEKQKKIKTPPNTSSAQTGFWATIRKLIKTCNITKLIISKDGNIIVNLPLTIVIIITIIMAPLVVVGLLAALFTGHKIRLEKPGSAELKINKTLDDISAAAVKVSEQVSDAIKEK